MLNCSKDSITPSVIIKINNNQQQSGNKMFTNPTLVIPGSRAPNTDPESPILHLLKDHNFYQSRVSKKDQIEILDNSYFTSEPESPTQEDIKHFKEKIEQLKKDECQNLQTFPLKVQRKRSPRLQEHSIIVVEEQNQVGSNFDQNESVIIEHIDFNEVKNEQQIEHTPRWEDRDYQNKNIQKFPINLGYKYAQPWLVDDQSNPSSSSPRDFQFESSKLTPIRKSKNTCVDRQELNEMSISNRSCIAKPVSGEVQFISMALPKNRFLSTQKTTQNIIFNHVLDRWNNQIYPFLQDDNCSDNLMRNEGKPTQETDERSMRLKQQTSKNQALSKEIEQLKYELERQISENQQLKTMLSDRDDLISTLKIKQKDMECIVFEKIRSEYLDQYNRNQKNIQLQQPTPTFLDIKSISHNKQVQSPNVAEQHQQCLRRMADLQQYIFDIEQQLIGIDIEVQKRVKIVERQITMELQQKLQQQMGKMKQIIQKIQLQKKEIRQQFNQKQRQLKTRENELEQLYRELQSQKKSVHKQNEREKISSFNRNCQQQLARPKSSNYQPSKLVAVHHLSVNPQTGPLLSKQKKNRASAYNEYSQYKQSSFNYSSKKPNCDDPQRYTSRVTKSLFNDFPKYQSKVYSKLDTQDSELHNINSKIQKLKNEISRQLCSIN